MKRNPKQSVAHPSYPGVGGWRPAVILSAVTLLSLGTGCPLVGQVDGDMAIPETGLEQLQLSLPVEGSHALYFAGPYAYVAYHLEITVHSETLAGWLAEHQDEVLAVADQALGLHQAQELDPSVSDLGALQPDLVTAIEAMDGVGAGALAALTLTVDAYDDQEQIDGDIAEPE
ncbi:MAG: hypothetical protein JXX28_11380 [Deltaproteobacteria bacterium]|nr:hypothetical protein [Deltaproteobacteria bacterium]